MLKSQTDGHFKCCEWKWNVSYKEKEEEEEDEEEEEEEGKKKEWNERDRKMVGRSFF